MRLVFPATLVALLAVALAAPAADQPAAPPGCARNDSASEKIGLKLSFQCWTYNMLTFFETVDKAVGLGVKYIEMYPGQTLKPGSKEKVGRTMSDEMAAEIKKKLADEGGLKLVAYGVDGIPTDEPGARKTFEWAKKMGIEVLVTETTPTELFDKLSEEFGIKVALHNHPKTWPPEKVLEATKNLSNRIGSCSDTGHWMRAEIVPVEALKKLEGRVEHLHFKDLSEPVKGHDVPWGTGR